jgi:hypothetical protein
MNTVVSPFTSFLPDVVPAGDDADLNTGASPVHLDELIHELRQPLGVIESLAYFIDLTTIDEKIRPRLEHIQSMLTKVHYMLEDASEKGVREWPAHLHHDHA